MEKPANFSPEKLNFPSGPVVVVIPAFGPSTMVTVAPTNTNKAPLITAPVTE
jgi:hypothetical protein